MARPGPATKLTPDVTAAIAAMAGRGQSIRSIVRGLAERGHSVSFSTVRRHLAATAPTTRPTATDALETAASVALSEDDIGAMTRNVLEVEAAMRSWATGIGHDPTSQRAYSALSRLANDLRSRLVELRPKPEVEREHFAELGHAAMTELVALARARAEQDWQGRYRRSEALLLRAKP